MRCSSLKKASDKRRDYASSQSSMLVPISYFGAADAPPKTDSKSAKASSKSAAGRSGGGGHSRYESGRNREDVTNDGCDAMSRKSEEHQNGGSAGRRTTGDLEQRSTPEGGKRDSRSQEKSSQG